MVTPFDHMGSAASSQLNLAQSLRLLHGSPKELTKKTVVGSRLEIGSLAGFGCILETEERYLVLGYNKELKVVAS